MYAEDTIAAIATPLGEGGIGIVRLSGPDAEGIAKRIFHCRGPSNERKLKSHMLYHGTIRDPRNGVILDEVLLTVMRAPRSYTGEDVVEVHCHGGALICRRILGLTLSLGARHAGPGEFTKRAFLNGRIDLAQAEAVIDLIRARTERGLELALNQARGELSKWVEILRQELLEILVQVEAAIDFPEEEIELLQRRELVRKIERLGEEIALLIDSYRWGQLFREGLHVCICGRPNVGKSSLLNALLGEARVIVTAIPGTTRDVIEESITLDGLPLTLWDTAGIRQTEDELEKIGVGLSRQRLESADILMLVLDGAEGLRDEDAELISLARKRKTLLVINKRDLPLALDIDAVRADTAGIPLVEVSCKEGIGLPELKTTLRKLALGTNSEPPVVITNERHRAALVKGREALAQAGRTLGSGAPADIVSLDLQEARGALEEIVGTVGSEDILERIFSQFCIGK
ncbi:MAG TPA: tRNA uridine-5-carboxymethylaminomethyl(34) synthesis GTPase MnmE [Candidatus Eisenbacteria bacterium]|nr:tRNA uridine-5-carboxymethylaminomethyl(34) synthesis GTPase MnmE [Candidatus Eisenbacteria bacterium]